MSVEEDAAQAFLEREAALLRYATIDSLVALEALRSRTADPKDREALDAVILQRRREEKSELEELNAVAELYDKAALPIAAALPVFLTFLAGEKLLVGPARTYVLVLAYLSGGVMWIFCRWKAYQCAREAKRGTALLGKVD